MIVPQQPIQAHDEATVMRALPSRIDRGATSLAHVAHEARVSGALDGDRIARPSSKSLRRNDLSATAALASSSLYGEPRNHAPAAKEMRVMKRTSFGCLIASFAHNAPVARGDR
jgi:hypothetical protein